ncbi:MAG: hypothetical protein IKN49_03270 [Elusimicrobiaceae bacterium]|nr:hypothetical protein [Elusimicrobiaceae bacterium]
MKSPAKIFLLLVWLAVIGGAAWGWWQFSHSGASAAFSLLQQGKFIPGQGKFMPVQVNDVSGSFGKISEPENFSMPSETVCLKETVQRAEEKLNTYIAEGVAQQENTIKMSSFSVQAKSCAGTTEITTVAEVQASCMADLCSYYIDFQQNGESVAMFVGSRSADQNGWTTSCSPMNPEIGKIVCDEITAPETAAQ